MTATNPLRLLMGAFRRARHLRGLTIHTRRLDVRVALLTPERRALVLCRALRRD